MAELFELVIGPPLEKRRKEWFQQIAEVIYRLEEERIQGFKVANIRIILSSYLR